MFIQANGNSRQHSTSTSITFDEMNNTFSKSRSFELFNRKIQMQRTNSLHELGSRIKKHNQIHEVLNKIGRRQSSKNRRNNKQRNNHQTTSFALKTARLIAAALDQESAVSFASQCVEQHDSVRSPLAPEKRMMTIPKAASPLPLAGYIGPVMSYRMRCGML